MNGSHVRGSFRLTEERVVFSTVISAPGKKADGMRQDTGLSVVRRDAGKLYAWAKVHAARLPRMSLAEFRDEMSIFNIRLA